MAVLPKILPETTETAPNSPIARALVNSTPYINPQRILGKVTRQKICQSFAPKVRPASSCSKPISSKTGITSLATKGIVTNIVANTIPGKAKSIFILKSSRKEPNQPLRP